MRARAAVSLLVVATIVGAAPAAESGRLRVLVTGDSMMQPLDEILEPRVEREDGRLISDPRPGTGIASRTPLDWVRYAKRQMRRHRPRATVMLIGPNDSGPLRTPDGREVRCCRRAWIDAYAERVGKVMRTYRRDGRAYVYWLTLPTPVEPHKARFTAINFAIKQAGADARSGVRVVDTVPVLSPRNEFRRRMRYKGRTVVIRDRDGVHLTNAGSRIAADLVKSAMRADGLL